MIRKVVFALILAVANIGMASAQLDWGDDGTTEDWDDNIGVGVTPDNPNVLVSWGAKVPWTVKYLFSPTAEQGVFDDPGNDAGGRAWTDFDYDDSSWGELTGPMGIGIDYAPYNYTWSGENNRHWLRRKFTIDVNPEGKIFKFECMYDDDIQVFLNGQLVIEASGSTGNAHASFEIPASCFRKGDNLFAIRLYQGGGGAYLDYVVTYFEDTAVHGIESDNAKCFRIYTIEGILLNPKATVSDLNGLSKGVYIINGQKRIIGK
ncbi:MAG: hypothetical protein ACI3ZD_14450 [Prevotella sp.]